MPPVITVSSHVAPPVDVYSPSIVFQITSLIDSYMIWVSAVQGLPENPSQVARDGRLSHDWACAMPPAKRHSSGSVTPLFATGDANLALSMAQRLARKFEKQIFLSIDLPSHLFAMGGTASLIILEIEKQAVTLLKELETKRIQNVCLLQNYLLISEPSILQHWKLTQIFDEITTNPAEWDSSGLLKIHPINIEQTEKLQLSLFFAIGEELEAYLNRWPEGFDRIVYIGDGSNDYCPIIRLRSQDMALVRRHRGLERRIAKEGGVQCSIKYWEGAWEIEEIFTAL
ncbi:hypothetical protein Clacol_000516 [Clathrus columnatus]|uniref:Uncharacterized protein n=1 Tax=Clathrus columnatus TaxID=1419009 RepID=A0AAV5A362_9AGAM|nr:hypothetical protein Clacol_000516 [Clathrus columnatus]